MNRRDLVAVAAIFVAAFVIGSGYERAFDRTGIRTPNDLRTLPSSSMWYGQSDFGAAVALACGRGYVDPPENDGSELTKFLSLQVDRFSCASLPASWPTRPLRVTQRLYPYLLSAVAAVWAMRGVSWSALWPLFGLVYASTMAIAYGLFRLATRRSIAAAVTALLMLSPIQIGNLPGLRDYAKAPFILGLILIAAVLIRRLNEPRAALAWSAAFGATLGIGFGFRNDILIIVPLVVVALFAWEPPRAWAAVRQRLATVATAFVVFVIVAFPILSGYTRGSNSGHVALLGLMAPFDRPLGVTRPIYEWGNVYSDGYADALVKSYAWRVHGRQVEYLSAEYDRMAVEYLLESARHWPADMIARTYASVLRIIDMPFHPGVHADEVPFAASTTVRYWYSGYNAVVSLLSGAGIVAVAAVLILVGGTRVWWAVVLLLDLLYLAGYPAIQFQPRHFFHLEFLAWGALAFLLESAIAFRQTVAGRLRPARIAIFAVVATLMIGVPFATARAYQERHLRDMFARYANAPRDAVSGVAMSTGARTLLRLPSVWDGFDPEREVNVEYVVARFSPRGCPVVRLPVTFRYAVKPTEQDFSFDTVITFLPAQPVDLFVPVYNVAEKTTFEGIEVARGFEACIETVERVRHPESLSILVIFQLTSGWTQTALYQRLADWEPAPPKSGPTLYALPPDLTLPVSTVYATPERPALLWRQPMLHDAEHGWNIIGTPRSPISPLFEFAPERRVPTNRFVIEGEVRHGGVTVGLVRNHQWTINGHVTITEPGPFIAVMAPVEAGEFGAQCENGLRGSWLLEYAPEPVVQLLGRVHDFNDVRITRAGWVQ